MLLHADWVPGEDWRKICSLNPRKISKRDQGLRQGSAAAQEIDIVTKRLCRRRNCTSGHRLIDVAPNTYKDQTSDRRDPFPCPGTTPVGEASNGGGHLGHHLVAILEHYEETRLACFYQIYGGSFVATSYDKGHWPGVNLGVVDFGRIEWASNSAKPAATTTYNFDKRE